MNIELKHDIFSNDTFKRLNLLIQILTDKQRYGVFVEWTLIKDTDLYQRLDVDDRKDLEEYYNQFINESLTTNYCVTNSISNTHTSDTYFNTEEAILFFRQPVSIFLENGLNDQFFIKALIMAFDNSGLLQKHLDNNWLVFDNMGGCTNLQNVIESKKLQFETVPKSSAVYLRCFALLDSDKKYATDAGNHTKNETYLNANNVAYHILEKRAMENYLPDEVYEQLSFSEPDTKWKNAFLNLSNEQKDFLNIPVGFSKKDSTGKSKVNRTDLDSNIQSLYKDLSQTNYDILDKGLKIADFKSSFPKYFKQPEVNWHTLKKRCKTNELQRIIDKIKQLL